MANKTIAIKIKRQADPQSQPFWEDFEVPWRPGMNVISVLMDIAASPVTRDGKATTPVTTPSDRRGRWKKSRRVTARNIRPLEFAATVD